MRLKYTADSVRKIADAVNFTHAWPRVVQFLPFPLPWEFFTKYVHISFASPYSSLPLRIDQF